MDMPAASTNHHENPKDAPSHVDQPSHHSASRLRPLAGHINYWDLFFLAMLILLAFKVNWGLHMMRDVWAPDEVFYMYSGYTFDPPHAEMAPLYSGWYSLLSLVAADPINLFYLSWFLLPMMLALGVYLLVRSLGGDPLFGFFSAAAVLVSSIPDIVPRPMHFAATLVLVGLAAALMFRSTALRLAVAALSLGLASFVRPEFTLAFFAMTSILMAVLLWLAWHRGASIIRLISIAAMAVLPFGLLAQCFGVPMGGTRGGVAFSQHYSFTKFEAGLIDVASRPNWTGPMQNYRDIVTEDFGKPVVSPLEALNLSPEHFFGHILRNTKQTFPRIGEIVSSESDAMGWIVVCYLALMILLGLAISINRIRNTSLSGAFSHAALPALMGIIVISPVAAACLVIHPRDHYLVGLLTVAIAYATSMTWGISLPNTSMAIRAAIVTLAFFVVIGAPNKYVQWDLNQLFASESNPAVRRWHVDTIEFIRQVPFQGKLHVLDKRTHGLFKFTDLEFESVNLRHVKELGFTTALDKLDLNVVVIPMHHPQRDVFRHDASYAMFRKQTPTGWVILGRRDLYWWLAVRRDALKPGAIDHLAVSPKLRMAAQNQYVKQLH